jgi:DNA-binding NarL/FixJ family response regulator
MRIALCSREPLFGEALASLLSHEGNFDVVVQEGTPRICLMKAKDSRAQIVVLDGESLQSNDLEFFMGARAYGDFGIVLIGGSELYNHDDHNFDSVVERNASSSGLFKSIMSVGSKFVQAQSRKVRERRHAYGGGIELTQREYEVASLVAKGYSNRRVAAVTGLREQSIKNLVSVIMRKLKCENRVQVALRLTSARIASESPNE